jgi:ABC-type glycerol-3-phosphate transport system substrate-binding protein
MTTMPSRRWSLLLLLALALAACQPAATPAPAATATTAPAAPPTEAPAPEPVTLRLLTPEGGGRPDGFTAAIAAYTALHPNVTIELQVVPFGEYYGLIPVQFAGDDPADITLVDSPAIKSFAYNEALLPLDDLYTPADLEDFHDSLLTEVTYAGHVWGGPFFQSTQGVFYNVDLFEAAGVQAPASVEAAWTWTEFVENVSRVVEQAEADSGGDVWGLVYLSNPPQATWSLPLVRSNGAPGSPTFAGLSPDETTAAGYLDTPEAMEAYQFWQDLYVTHQLVPPAEVPDAFGNGQAATMISFSAWGGVLDAVWPDLNWAVMPLPYLRTPIVHASHFVPTVAAKSDHPAEAKAFVQWLTSREGFLAYYAVTSDMPARKSLLNELPAFQTGELKIFRDTLLQTAQPNPGGPGGAIYAQIVGQMLADIAQGAEIESTVHAAVQELDGQLEQFK